MLSEGLNIQPHTGVLPVFKAEANKLLENLLHVLDIIYEERSKVHSKYM